jgi:hypothetical protein
MPIFLYNTLPECKKILDLTACGLPDGAEGNHGRGDDVIRNPHSVGDLGRGRGQKSGTGND